METLIPITKSQLNTPGLSSEKGQPHRLFLGQWIAVIILGIYFLSIFQPPFLPEVFLRWYMVWGLAFFAYILGKRKIQLGVARVFIMVYGFSFFGAVISLLRSSNLDLALWNTVGFGLNFVAYILFLPILALKSARKLLLLLLIGTSFLWVIQIQGLIAKYGILNYSSFAETSRNKNQVGLFMAMAAVSLFYLALFWKQPKKVSNFKVLIIRGILYVGTLIFIFHVSLIYDRSSLLLAVFGLGVGLVLKIFSSANKVKSILQVGMLVFLIIISIQFLLPTVLEIAPSWDKIYNNLTEREYGAYSIRITLLNKGLYIIRQNPLLGIGIGNTRSGIDTGYVNFPYYYIHNSYISEWAERGILGLLSIIVWVNAYFKIVRDKYFDLAISDQIWLFVFGLWFIAMNLMDSNTSNIFMLAILSGMHYDQYYDY